MYKSAIDKLNEAEVIKHSLADERVNITLTPDEAIQLRKRLEKLEAVVEAGRRLVESAITQADILADGSIVPTKCSVDPEEFDKLGCALAALEDV
jgi:microsomal dipeptidase-like Zn-dependent dipeptidase